MKINLEGLKKWESEQEFIYAATTVVNKRFERQRLVIYRSFNGIYKVILRETTLYIGADAAEAVNIYNESGTA